MYDSKTVVRRTRVALSIFKMSDDPEEGEYSASNGEDDLADDFSNSDSGSDEQD